MRILLFFFICLSLVCYLLGYPNDSEIIEKYDSNHPSFTHGKILYLPDREVNLFSLLFNLS